MMSPDAPSRPASASSDLDPELLRRAQAWTRPPFDAATRSEAERLLATATSGSGPEATAAAADLADRFALDLVFGTGGLRGVMGVGSNRMNRYTVGRATQGIADTVRAHGHDHPSAVICYDSRHGSREFAHDSAAIFAANGIKTYLFASLRPTPMLSFATLRLGTNIGVMITASHNPPEYNGYKVYAGNGQQVIGDEADEIVRRVNGLAWEAIRFEDFARLRDEGMIELLDPDFDSAYLDVVREACLAPDLCERHGADLKIVFTPLHGTGATVIPTALEQWGFSAVTVVGAQAEPNGDFPTTKTPNPEEREALALALRLGDDLGADLVMGTDPDADRVGIAVRDDAGALTLLNGNETGALLAWYQIARRRETGALPPNAAIISTVVSSEIFGAIAAAEGVEFFETLTGFKYIGALMNAWDDNGRAEWPTKEFLWGGEESYGYLVGRHTRDKDAVVACCAVAEAAAWARERGETLWQVLARIHATCGVHREGLYNRTLRGLKGMEQIAAIIARLRNDPPREMAGFALGRVRDLGEGVVRDAGGRVLGEVDLPRENVVQLYYGAREGDGGGGGLAGAALKITGRPSGTEPKIKFYLAAAHRDGLPLEGGAVPAVRADLDARLEAARATIAALIDDVVG